MESKLTLSTGEILEIPLRLMKVIQSDDGNRLTYDSKQFSKLLEDVVNAPDDYSQSAISATLYVGKEYQKNGNNEEALFYLGLYFVKKAKSLSELGKPDEGVALLADVMQLQHSIWIHCTPDLAQRIADSLIMATQVAIRLCAEIASFNLLCANFEDIQSILNIAATVLEPQYAPSIGTLGSSISSVVGATMRNTAFPQNEAREFIKRLSTAKLKWKKEWSSSDEPKFWYLLESLTDSWLDIIQQEILLIGKVEYSFEDLDIDKLARHVNHLVGEVERRLRMIISERYAKQFGDGWVHHIETKHKPMFDRWTRYMEKDRQAFNADPSYSPTTLDYALLEDLADLIAAQWHLFRLVFDFGYQDRNRAVFYDKMKQISQVRNNLAHNRMAPENELLRTRVLCIDILQALDKNIDG